MDSIRRNFIKDRLEEFKGTNNENEPGSPFMSPSAKKKKKISIKKFN